MQSFWLLLALSGMTTQHDLPVNCDANICWDVSPQICVTEQQKQSCQSQLQLHWYSDTAQNTCLYLAEQKLQCWQNVTQGHWKQKLSWENAALTLRSPDNQILLQTELQVLSRKPARRRLSSPWSIF
ncbi:DUF3019 domain-containing protein [Rheinheimera baltica]|uniref:DUF3019 domain-containing protein n=1 Tax=Rheinheimera baltica TaxID=67576 RepID=A0ABT9I124_9GAMM|nr:DUF3019 domain-containing protein [Rheinheimera baltica]MDP5137097.1 DUF3019 domain-containing protein [Rheinheimera baltica]MDP5142426.1 DUF3019 domain-containing protein [Rheinheimera baltica]MDP5150671.1 DUF3019 domain-containing protein [Rheinheimera baltica]MDP5191236.1 DUF3019 domain-containing protein [Rheinheimera baltica]